MANDALNTRYEDPVAHTWAIITDDGLTELRESAMARMPLFLSAELGGKL